MSNLGKNTINNSVSYTEDAGFTVFAEQEDSSFVMESGESNSQTYRETIPGSDRYLDEIEETPVVVEKAPEAPKTWQDHRAVEDFMNYIKSSYPSKIPKHDGKSVVGAQRAITWLTNLGKEISEAVRKDDKGILGDDNIAALEEYRVKIMKDILLLKEHVKKLNVNFNNSLKKKAGLDENLMKWAEEIEIAYNHDNKKDLRKTAAHPKLQIFVTPFERAVAGIIINSVIVGGKPLEEVYEFLQNKYELTDREELAIMQIIMDSGFPIFKDRGTFSSKKSKDSKATHGIEFIKNYFA